MSYKSNLLYNGLELPAYWWYTEKARWHLQPQVRVNKIRFGTDSKQYFLSIDRVDWEESAQRPWVIYLHGGAWTFGTPEQFLPAARIFLDAGYRVIMPSYRRLTRQNFSGIWTDLRSCLRVLHQRDWSGPAIVSGMSAGGHLAASLAWRAELWNSFQWPVPPKVILCGAVLDLRTMPPSFGLKKLAGPPEARLFNEANPAHWLAQRTEIPMAHLLVHGTADKMVAVQQSSSTCEVLTKRNTEVTTLILENGTHLDACRWMYREDEVSIALRQFIVDK